MIFSGNLKIEYLSDGFIIKNKDQEITTFLNKTKIGKLEFEFIVMQRFDSTNLIWMLSLFYPSSQCRLVIYLFNYFLTPKRFSTRAT